MERLSISGPFEFTSQDPAKDGEIFMRMQVTESLLDVDDQGQLTPGLAEHWRVLDGGLLWEFTLRNGVHFHDGSPFTAEAAVQSIQIAMGKPGPIQLAPIDRIVTDGVANIKIHLSRPYNPLGGILAHYSLVMLAPRSYREDGEVSHLYATGPYVVEEIDTPHRLVVSRNDDYWGTPGSIPTASYLTGHRAESRALQVRTGQADIVYTLDPSALNMLSRSKDVVVHSREIPRLLQLKLNSGHRFLNTVGARRAVSLALDREAMTTRILRSPGTAANQLAPRVLAEWHVPDLEPVQQDLALALELLEAEGWRMGSRGLLEREGEAFRLRLMTYADRPELTILATAIQAQLRMVGVDIHIDIVNSGSIPLAHVDGTLEVALIARNYGFITDPLAVYISDYGGENGGEWGAMNWNHAELDQLLTELAAETDPQRYRGLAQRSIHILAAELPVIPIAFYTQQSAHTVRLQGFSFDPYERNYRIAQMRLEKP